MFDFCGGVKSCLEVWEGAGHGPVLAASGPLSHILAPNPHLLQVGVHLLPSMCTHFPHLLQVCTGNTLSAGLARPSPLPGTHSLSPLTKGMQARQDFGAPVPIQADTAHQKLLVHRLDLWARAVVPLCHGVHGWLLPLTPACIQRQGQPQGSLHFLSPPDPHYSNPLQRTNPISSQTEAGQAVIGREQGEEGGLSDP